MGPTWVLSAPDGPHVGPMNFAIREIKLYPELLSHSHSNKAQSGLHDFIYIYIYMTFSQAVLPMVSSQSLYGGFVVSPRGVGH